MLIQTAMAEAVQAAYDEGVHDPEVIRERMQMARDTAREAFNAAMARILAEEK